MRACVAATEIKKKGEEGGIALALTLALTLALALALC